MNGFKNSEHKQTHFGGIFYQKCEKKQYCYDSLEEGIKRMVAS